MAALKLKLPTEHPIDVVCTDWRCIGEAFEQVDAKASVKLPPTKLLLLIPPHPPSEIICVYGPAFFSTNHMPSPSSLKTSFSITWWKEKVKQITEVAGTKGLQFCQDGVLLACSLKRGEEIKSDWVRLNTSNILQPPRTSGFLEGQFRCETCHHKLACSERVWACAIAGQRKKKKLHRQRKLSLHQLRGYKGLQWWPTARDSG
eukprot:526640-Pelagomonas_calceolata.AAC.1